MFFPSPLMYGMTVSHTRSSPGGGCNLTTATGMLLPAAVLPTWVLLLPFPSWLPLITLFHILLIAHLGCLHLSKAFLRCCNSLRSSGVVLTVLALWFSISLTLLGRKTNPTASTGQYVCLQYTYAKGVVCLRFDQGIKKRDSPVLLVTFNSELNILSCLWTCCWMTKVSSTNLYHSLGADLRAAPSKCSITC